MRLVSDLAWAVMTLDGEARGEPYAGKVAVAEVIRNRMANRYFSDGTVAGTVLKAMQFSCWNAHDPNRVVIAQLDDSDLSVRECISAWNEAEGVSLIAEGAMHYYNPSAVTPTWISQATFSKRIGNHVFCRLQEYDHAK